MKLFKQKQDKQPEADMNKIIPVRCVDFEISEKDRVVLLKPKFSSKFVQKYIIPKMKYPYYHIHLDEVGTSVWNSINGKRTAVEIGEKLKRELGEKIDPVYERLGMFLAKLRNEKFIKW